MAELFSLLFPLDCFAEVFNNASLTVVLIPPIGGNSITPRCFQPLHGQLHSVVTLDHGKLFRHIKGDVIVNGGSPISGNRCDHLLSCPQNCGKLQSPDSPQIHTAQPCFYPRREILPAFKEYVQVSRVDCFICWSLIVDWLININSFTPLA